MSSESQCSKDLQRLASPFSQQLSWLFNTGLISILQERSCLPLPQARDNRRKISHSFENIHRPFPETTSLQRPLPLHKAFRCCLNFTLTQKGILVSNATLWNCSTAQRGSLPISHATGLHSNNPLRVMGWQSWRGTGKTRPTFFR